MEAAVARTLRIRSVLRGRSLVDVFVVAFIWWGFDLLNNFGGAVRQQLAERHAHSLLHFERTLGLSPELDLNHWLAAQAHWFQAPVVWWYDWVHGIVTIGVFVALWWFRSPALPSLRIAIVAASLAALAIFWSWPVAPQWMFPQDGFIDVIYNIRGGGTWHPGQVAADPAQLCAFPSLHIAWALWAAVAIWRLVPRWWARVFALAYAPITTFVVMATASHYLADAVAGAAIMALAIVAADRFVATRSPPRPRRPRRRARGSGPQPARRS